MTDVLPSAPVTASQQPPSSSATSSQQRLPPLHSTATTPPTDGTSEANRPPAQHAVPETSNSTTSTGAVAQVLNPAAVAGAVEQDALNENKKRPKKQGNKRAVKPKVDGEVPEKVPRKKGPSITLASLLESGLLKPGVGILTTEYKGSKFKADLTADGRILHNHLVYDSPSAWSIAMKRTVSPDRKADDGWKSVKYEGVLLEKFKAGLLRTYNIQSGVSDTGSTKKALKGTKVDGKTFLPSKISDLEAHVLTQAKGLVGAENVNNIVLAAVRVATAAAALQAETNPPQPAPPAHNPVGQLVNPQSQEQANLPALAPSTQHHMHQQGGALTAPHATPEMTMGAAPPTTAPAPHTTVQGAIAPAPKVSFDPMLIKAYFGKSHATVAVTNAEEEKRSEYASARLRNCRKPAKRFSSLLEEELKDPLTMVTCESYTNNSTQQPFRVNVSNSALAVMDFHAHLCHAEIIGFLAGSWDPSTRMIIVDSAFPCRSLDTEDDSKNVEMDPHSELETRELISKLDKRVVGWYHSHPVFEPCPSVRDIENQANYQFLFKDGMTNPFVGAIVSPYDTSLPDLRSKISWFNVLPTSDGRTLGTPMNLQHNIVNDQICTTEVGARLESLVSYYKAHPRKVDLWERWSSVSRLEKLSSSFLSHFGPDEKCETATQFLVNSLDQL